jgi:hypothetical protein
VRHDLLVADTVAVICQCEALGLVGRRFDIPVLRSIPLVTHVCNRYVLAAGALFIGLGVHLALSRS